MLNFEGVRLILWKKIRVMKNLNDINRFQADFEVLTGHSELAFKLKSHNYDVFTVLNWGDYDPEGTQHSWGGDDQGLGFHPNGRTGCINLDDSYFFGIRCDHLIWMDGMCEERCCPAITLVGNHKGGIILKVILFKEEN